MTFHVRDENELADKLIHEYSGRQFSTNPSVLTTDEYLAYLLNRFAYHMNNKQSSLSKNYFKMMFNYLSKSKFKDYLDRKVYTLNNIVQLINGLIKN